jgi:hypothetical protein
MLEKEIDRILLKNPVRKEQKKILESILGIGATTHRY